MQNQVGTHSLKSLPKWAQRRIASLESRSGLADTQNLLAEVYPIVKDVAEHPWPTTWPKSKRLYIAAVPLDFEQRLNQFIKKLNRT